MITAYYTYLWLRKNGTPYYVGKTARLSRAYGGGRHSVHRPLDKDRIVVQDWPSEEDAISAEMLLIACYGRMDNGTGMLYNHTDGGEGSSGQKQSAETIRRRASQIRGRARQECVRKAISASKLGKKNPSYKARGERHWNRGLTRSEETRRELRAKRALQDMSYRRKSVCKRGHERTPDNTDTKRSCRLCKRLLRGAL